MVRLIVSMLLILSFGAAAEESVEKCMIDRSRDATIIACPEYVITKTQEKTMICRLVRSHPKTFCTQVP